MPHERMDRLLPQSRRSNHIVVASCNQFYILRLGQDPLDNPYRKDASCQLNETSIFDQLLRIYRISRENAKRDLLANGSGGGGAGANCPQMTPANSPNVRNRIPKVGLLTTENRKTWARLHKKLSHCSGATNCATNSNQAEPARLAEQQQRQQMDEEAPSGSCSPTNNTDSLRLIEDCLSVMCLDSLVKPSPLASLASREQEPSEQGSVGEAPMATATAAATTREADDETDVEAANIILTGGGSHLFTGNRWFDKFLQIIVGRDGICGINIEHSASEGITVLRFLEEFLHFIKCNPIGQRSAAASALSQPHECECECDGDDIVGKTFNYFAAGASASDSASASAGALSVAATLGADSITSPAYVEPLSPSELLQESDKITPLCWTLDDELCKALDEAELRANKLIENFSLNILRFAHFGRSFIKNQNLSPDAFIQLALQYTFFKMHGRLVSTYESASLRQFRLGRVDNIRANTCEAFDWIQAMLACKRKLKEEASKEVKGAGECCLSAWKPAEEAFIKAITKQVEILRYTIFGGGPDNHLLALKQLARIRYYDDELPDMFKDPSYQEFLNFRLSTSQLPNESGITVGYGAVTPDGYGCSYNPCEDRIIFCVSSFVDCPETSSSKFASKLEESLLEMRHLCLARGQQHK